MESEQFEQAIRTGLAAVVEAANRLLEDTGLSAFVAGIALVVDEEAIRQAVAQADAVVRAMAEALGEEAESFLRSL